MADTNASRPITPEGAAARTTETVRRDWWRFVLFAGPTRESYARRTVQVGVVVRGREYRVIYVCKDWVE